MTVKYSFLLGISGWLLAMTACTTQDIDCDDGYEEDGDVCVLEDDDDTPPEIIVTVEPPSTSTDDCDGEILEFFPSDGNPSVYFRTAIEFTLEQTRGNETITVSQGANEVPGTTTVDDNRVSFTANTNLDPNTAYSVTLNWCNGPTTTGWTTSDVGDPVDTAAIVGRVFEIDIGQGRFATPAGIGPLIQQQLEEPVLIGADRLVGNDLEMRAAPGNGAGQQDLCNTSVEFPLPTPFDTNPYFDTGAGSDLIWEIEGIEIVVEGPRFTGAYDAYGAEIHGVTLDGILDTRDIGGLVGATGDDNALCDLVVTFGVSCFACTDGQPFCLDMTVDNMTAFGAPDVTLQSITPQQADNCP